VASSMTPARGTWRLGLRLVYGFSHGPVLSVRRRDGVKAPPGALTPRRGRCRTSLVTDALEARQEAHSIWEAAGDRYRSGETPPLPIPPALVRP